MIPLLLLLIGQGKILGDPHRIPIPFNSLLATDGWILESGLKRPQDRDSNYVWVHSSRVGARMRVDLRPIGSEQEFQSLGPSYDRKTPKARPRGHEDFLDLPSRSALGRFLRVSVSQTDCLINAASRHFSLRLRASLGRRPTSTVPVSDVIWGTEDIEKFEGYARWLLAELSAESHQTVRITYGGAAYDALKHPKGELHLPAKLWAQRNGYTLDVNQKMGRAYLTGPKGSVLLPLGSPKAKVGSVWVELDEGVLIAKEGEVYIPVKAIQRLQSQ